MYKSWFVISIFTGFIFLLACNSKEETAPEKKARMRAGDVPMSELANMMRDMQEQSEELRQQIIAGDTTNLPKFSFDLQEMKTAEATEPSMKDDPFNAFTDHFDRTFAEVYKSEISKKTAFNNMVASCLNCHQQFCSGPMKMISALKIDSGSTAKNPDN
jgi:hypothetical protein